MPPQTRSLSKSKVVQGLQCEKALWLAINDSGLATDTSDSRQAVFDQGKAVGILARTHFKNGLLIDFTYTELDQAVKATTAAIERGEKTLFEATFLVDGMLAQIDVLRRDKVGGLWHIVEVKSSTRVKDEHITDSAIQTYVVRVAGLTVKSVSIMHINTECVFPDLKSLFKTEDVTEQVEERMKTVPKEVAALQAVLRFGAAPPRDIGSHCDAPYECEFKDHCWSSKKIPEISVFDIPGLFASKKWEMYSKNAVSMKEVVKSRLKLNPTQARMVDVTLSGRRFTDANAIAKELKKWKYPLYFLDFETINPAIPRFPGTKPYQQIPFQWSCHAQMKSGGMLLHSEYLHDTNSDPREPLVKGLLAAIGPKGSVVSYNKGFEAGCLTSLAREFPKYGKGLLSIVERLVDPWPIVKAHVYDKEFRGSFSIKDVAPALLGPDLSYDGMAVADGIAAQLAYAELIGDGTSSSRKAELRRAMLEYCKKDTAAMVGVVEWLNSVLA